MTDDGTARGTAASAGWVPAEIASRLQVVKDRVVAAGGDIGKVRIVAVAKTFPADAIRAAISAGIVDFGENYADELVEKARELEGEERITWRFIGAIQRNKLARLAPYVACYEGVTRIAEGRDIARRAPGASLFVEVDTTGIESRTGVAPDVVGALVTELSRLDLEVRGLMTVAPPGGGEAARRCFETVGELARELGLAECSMGMSDDLELAVAAGSTEIRVGTSLFGPRATG
jgi:pyridoxal phosphate enzyme (YggS family)